MSVRATSLAFLFGAMVLGGASAAERPDRAAPSARRPAMSPVASEVRLGGDDTQTRLILDLQPEDRHARLHASPIPIAW